MFESAPFPLLFHPLLRPPTGFFELAHKVGGKPMIRDNPPTIYHSRGDAARDEEGFYAALRQAFVQYRESLRPSVRVPSTVLNSRTRPSMSSVLAAWAQRVGWCS